MDFDRITPDIAGCDPEPSRKLLRVPGKALSLITAQAFDRMSFTFSREHLGHLASVATDPLNSDNDRLVASLLLENAVISAQGTFPLCQDTGTAQVFAWKDNAVLTDCDDTVALSAGIEKTWTTRNLRYSTTKPESIFDERDPGNNMPAQIVITGTPTGEAPVYRFLFCAKGGGSSNKTSLTQATKALLTETAFDAFLGKQIPLLGTAACPPYSIAVVVGGISPEQNLMALKLATAGYFDRVLPGWDYRVFGTMPLRDTAWEARVLEIAANSGLGAQFGGRALAVSARVLRLPRHGASCPVSVGVSCCAHRNLLGYIDESGIWIEHTERDPLAIPAVRNAIDASRAARTTPRATEQVRIDIDLDAGLDETRKALAGLKPGTPVYLSGKMLVARDAAHARWRTRLSAGESLPDYATRYAIIYAGPSNTPPGCVTGSFGPTTAGRMDDYTEDLMSRGAALITLAKGNRSEAWRKACETWRATYLGTPGGVAALIAEKHITSSEVIDYADLGMEAVRLVTVRDLPAFVLVNDRGEDFYGEIAEGRR